MVRDFSQKDPQFNVSTFGAFGPYVAASMKCSGQPIPDTMLSFSSATAGVFQPSVLRGLEFSVLAGSTRANNQQIAINISKSKVGQIIICETDAGSIVGGERIVCRG